MLVIARVDGVIVTLGVRERWRAVLEVMRKV